jgi:hypothetical protein
MKTQSITESFTQVLEKETCKLSKKSSKLKNAYIKFAKMGIDIKSTYTLPLKDTIGKTFMEQLVSK